MIDDYNSWLVDMFIITYLLQGYEKPKLFFLGSVPSKPVDRKCPVDCQMRVFRNFKEVISWASLWMIATSVNS